MVARKKLLGVLAILILSAVSCGPSEPVTTVPVDHARLKALVTAYAYACRDLQHAPEEVEELFAVLEQAKVENPREYLTSTRDGEPYVVIWKLDLARRYHGSNVPIAYERVGHDGIRRAQPHKHLGLAMRRR